MPIPPSLADFNILEATVSVWLFRKSGSSDNPVFTGHWIQTDALLDAALKTGLSEVRNGVAEVIAFDILVETAPEQALVIETDVTHAQSIVDKTADELPARRAATMAHMSNSDFYVVKLIHGDNVLHAVRRTDDSWSTKKTRSRIAVVFSGDELGLEENPSFTLSRYVDFFIAGDDIVILNKKAFEIVLSFKQAHADDFVALQAEPTFAALFTDMAPLLAYVGTNKLHLRRVSAIHQKAHFHNRAFMDRLRARHREAGLDLTFDGNGRFVPSAHQCADIVKALLNHRLYSLFSEGYFDVQSAVEV